MKEFEWINNMTVNNDTIDGHHKKLIQLFNEVGRLIESDQAIPLFSTIKILSELNVYAIFHFKEEEKLMEAGNYPNIVEHKQLHKLFIEKLAVLKEEYLHNDMLVNYELFNFLSQWVLDHIINEDSKYKDYI